MPGDSPEPPTAHVTEGDGPDPTQVRVVAAIQARMGSTRLPGKVLADVGGTPMLALTIRRLRRAQTLSAICVATTTSAADDPVAALAGDQDVDHVRGSETDVLSRTLAAARACRADVIVRVPGDKPLVDPGLVDACVLAYFAHQADYCANNLEPTFPQGAEVEVFSTAVLAEIDGITDDPADREHVSLYIYEHADRYRILNVPAVGRLRRPEMRWTVDTPEDLELVRRVVGAAGPDITTREVVDFLLDHPEVAAINREVSQKTPR